MVVTFVTTDGIALLSTNTASLDTRPVVGDVLFIDHKVYQVVQVAFMCTENSKLLESRPSFASSRSIEMAMHVTIRQLVQTGGDDCAIPS